MIIVKYTGYKREQEIINDLLRQKNITEYEFLYIVGEGKDLPESTYEGEVEEVSGEIVTEDAVYGFWLFWVDGHYSLGDGKRYWHKFSLDDRAHEVDVQEALQQLRQRKKREIE